MTEFDWIDSSAEKTAPLVPNLAPTDVMFEMDGPRIFTQSHNSQLFLFYLCQTEGSKDRFIVAPTNSQIVNELKRGWRSVREALVQPQVWILDIDHSGSAPATWHVFSNLLPDDILPKSHVMLWPHLEPIFSVRATGRELTLGRIKASAVRRVVDGAYAALKRVAESVEGLHDNVGRPEKALRELFDLPVQRISFGSIEIAFGNPEPTRPDMLRDAELNQRLVEMSKVLDQSLVWADDARGRLPAVFGKTLVAFDLPSFKNQWLSILEPLVPPQEGPIDEIQVRGRLLGNQANGYVLTRSTSRIVRSALASIRSEVFEVQSYHGLVREFDKDKMSFILRDEAGKDLVTCLVSDELYETALFHFNEDEPTYVTGKKHPDRNAVEVLAFSSIPPKALEVPLLPE